MDPLSNPTPQPPQPPQPMTGNVGSQPQVPTIDSGDNNPQWDFPQDDPEMWTLLGEELDRQRNSEASNTLTTIRPAVASPVRYATYTPADPGGGWAAVFDPAGWKAQAPVYEEDKTDQQAIERHQWDSQKPTGYLLARTMSQATFGASTYMFTSNFEKTFQSEHPNEANEIEMGALGLNLVAWPITPAGKVIDMIYEGTTGFLTRKVMQSKLGALLLEEKLEVPVSSWIGRAFSTLKTIGEDSIKRLENVVSKAGGKFLGDGSLFVPEGVSRDGIKTAINELRQITGSSQKVKIFTDPTKHPILQRVIASSMGVGGMAAAGGGAEISRTLVDLIAGEDISLKEATHRTAKGAMYGAAVGVPFAIASAVFKSMSASTTLRGKPTEPPPRLLSEAHSMGAASPEPGVWNVQTQGPVPTGWKGKVVSR